jgi:hypothetical protein
VSVWINIHRLPCTHNSKTKEKEDGLGYAMCNMVFSNAVVKR